MHIGFKNSEKLETHIDLRECSLQPYQFYTCIEIFMRVLTIKTINPINNDKNYKSDLNLSKKTLTGRATSISGFLDIENGNKTTKREREKKMKMKTLTGWESNTLFLIN